MSKYLSVTDVGIESPFIFFTSFYFTYFIKSDDADSYGFSAAIIYSAVLLVVSGVAFCWYIDLLN